MLYLLCPRKPGTCAPPPTEPARLVNFMPHGVMSVKSLSTVIMALHIGRMAAMHSQHPHVVMGSTMRL